MGGRRNGKVMIIHLIVGLIKRHCIKISKYFPSLKSFERNINVKVDLSNYATKTDIKIITHIDTSDFASKTSRANLKTEGDKLETDKLVTVPVDLSKLCNVVKNKVVRKTENIIN